MRLGMMGFVLLAAGCLEADPRWMGAAGGGQDSGGTHTGATGTTSGTGSDADGTSGTGGATGGGTGSDSGGATGGTGSDSGGATGDTTSSDKTSTASTGTGGTGSTGISSTGTGDTGSTGGGLQGCSELWAEPGWTLEDPVHLADLSSDGFDGDPYLSADALTLYFASDRQGGPGESNVFVATRTDLDSPFGNVVLLDDINTNDSEWTFAVTADGLLAYLVSDRQGGAGAADLWQVTRASVGDPWGIPEPISELNSDGDEWDAFTTPNGLILYYNVGGTDADNYRASRPSRTEPFGPGTPLALNTTETESTPTLSEDRLLIVFGSYRSGGLGSQDLWYATRPSVGDAFGPPEPLPVVNTADNEGESHLRYDACEMFFTSGDGGVGAWDLYSTRFVPP